MNENKKTSNEISIFYTRLRELVQASGKSMNRVEKELGLPRNALSNYKHLKEPGARRLLVLADYFNVSPKYLIDFKSSERR